MNITFMKTELKQSKVILNLAASGRVSSDHNVAEHAKEIWNAGPFLTA